MQATAVLPPSVLVGKPHLLIHIGQKRSSIKYLYVIKSDAFFLPDIVPISDINGIDLILQG